MCLTGRRTDLAVKVDRVSQLPFGEIEVVGEQCGLADERCGERDRPDGPGPIGAVTQPTGEPDDVGHTPTVTADGSAVRAAALRAGR